VKPPYTEKVPDKKFLGLYFNFFGDQRPLTAVEIGHIYSIMEIKANSPTIPSKLSCRKGII